MGKFLSYIRKDFKYLYRVNVEEWHEMWLYAFSWKKIAHKGLTWTLPVPVLYITEPELGHQYAVYECSVANRPTGDYRTRKGFLHISDFRGNKDKETHHNIPF